MKRVILIIYVVIICVFSMPILRLNSVKAAENIQLYALSAALIDGDTGRVLYEKNGYDVRAMASTTKIMTLILALEYGNIDDLVTVSDYAAKMPDVQLNIKAGEQYVLEDLLYSLILESHNDSAVAVAEHIGGDVGQFASMMNKKARELGLSNTYFITPNGLDASDEAGIHGTTAVELARIMKYCIMESPKKEEFIRICQTRNHSFTDYNETRSFSVNNKNALLDMMSGVIAGKTGFTGDAGYCYVGAIEQNNKTYIVALLGCGWPNNKSYKWSDCKELFNYGTENYNYTTVLDKSLELAAIKVLDGVDNDFLEICVKDEVGLIVKDEEKISYEYVLPNTVTAPIKKGDILGHLDIYIGKEIIATVNIYADENIEKKDFWYCFKTTFLSFIQ